MNVHLTTLSLCIAGIAGSFAHAGGLNLSQIATTESVGTAGVGNVTSNDASAVITNAANLSEISESAWILGLQYLDVESNFVRSDNGSSTTGSSSDILPHISYATRVNDKWVGGVALHAAGGVGVKYSQGVGANPAQLINENSIAALNLTSSLSYQLGDNLSLGGSLTLQRAALEVRGLNGLEVKGDSVDLGFALSLSHNISEDTQLGVNYQGQFDHDFSIEKMNSFGLNTELTWVETLSLGLRHALNEDVNVLLSANMEAWQDYDDKYSATYSFGVGLEYAYESWLFYSGVSGDTSPVDSQNRDVLLPLDQQWRIGFGAERKISQDLQLGLSYQFQHLGDGEINADSGLFQPNGHYSTNRVHFITLSLRY
ncbi:OmpP1/FadL family transporter [Vibrio cionasavignyae]|uniref:OmpP1/FadL family transporter n=1 Tax=Vibrio cionasavignyae TaxID=2910252 RepID=UPI003D0BBEC7